MSSQQGDNGHNGKRISPGVNVEPEIMRLLAKVCERFVNGTPDSVKVDAVPSLRGNTQTLNVKAAKGDRSIDITSIIYPPSPETEVVDKLVRANYDAPMLVSIHMPALLAIDLVQQIIQFTPPKDDYDIVNLSFSYFPAKRLMSFVGFGWETGENSIKTVCGIIPSRWVVVECTDFNGNSVTQPA